LHDQSIVIGENTPPHLVYYLQISEGDICSLSIGIHGIQDLLIVGVVTSVIVVAGTVVCPIPA
jgi:hypothetical protein